MCLASHLMHMVHTLDLDWFRHKPQAKISNLWLSPKNYLVRWRKKLGGKPCVMKALLTFGQRAAL